MHINCLIVDDEVELAQSTAAYFNLFDVSAQAVFDAAACLAFLNEHTVDLLLLDINLEHTSGFDLCKTIRETMNLLILFISARQSDDDILLALNIGGDDYIRKPYSLSVLLAKVKAVLKRYAAVDQDITIGNLKFEFSAKKVLKQGALIPLKGMEFYIW